jgi:hypothetical protein
VIDVDVVAEATVRRTSSLDISWSDGPGRPMRMVGRARKIRTDDQESRRILA